MVGVVLKAVNETRHRAALVWIDEDSAEERTYATIQPGQEHLQETFPNHSWRLGKEGTSDGCTIVMSEEPMQVLVLPAEVACSEAADRGCSGVPDAFYSQSVCIGSTQLRVRASAVVSPWALAAASEIVQRMLELSPVEVVRRLVEAGCTVAVIGRAQLSSDIPEHAWLSGARTGNWEVDSTTRGLGGNPSVPVTSVGEENLIDDEEGEPAAATPAAAPIAEAGAMICEEVCEEVGDGDGGGGLNTCGATPAPSAETVASTAYCTNRSFVMISTSGTSAPAIAKHIIPLKILCLCAKKIDNKVVACTNL